MSESIDINVNSLINSKPNKPDQRSYNEDIQMGESRAGRVISFKSASTKKLSGIKLVFLPGAEEKTIEEDFYGGSLKRKTLQGINVKSFADTVGDILPYVHIGRSPYNNNVRERFTPFLKIESFKRLEKINTEKFIPFNEITEHTFNAKDYINITDYGKTRVYPQFTGSHYLDELRLDGVIEPLEIRTLMFGKSMTNDKTLVNRGFFHDISCQIMGSTKSDNIKNSIIISDMIEIKETAAHQSLFFDDSIQGYRITNKTKPIPFSGDKNSSKVVPYDDGDDRLNNNLKKVPRVTAFTFDQNSGQLIEVTNHIGGLGTAYENRNSYGFMNGKQRSQLLSGSIRDISDVGNRFLSLNAGFIYENTGMGNNNVVGTDSLAFGGLRGDSYRYNNS